MRDFCPICGREEELVVLEKEYNLPVNDQIISVIGQYYSCKETGFIFQTEKQLDETLLRAKEKYTELYEKIRPQEIIKVREKYNVSQKAFGLLLGMGELTINKYEQGSVPVGANRLLIELSKNPDCFYQMYALNKNKISSLQRKKIESCESFRQSKMSDAVGGKLLITPMADMTIQVPYDLQSTVRQLAVIQKLSVQECLLNLLRSKIESVTQTWRVNISWNNEIGQNENFKEMFKNENKITMESKENMNNSDLAA